MVGQARVNAGSFETYQQHRTGETVSITYLPDDPAATRLTATVRANNPLTLTAAALALLLSGIVASWVGWRMRRANRSA